MTQDKEANTSGVAEPKDAQETAAEDGKGSEEGTPQTDKETKEGGSEECSSESKVEGTEKLQQAEARSPEDAEKVFASKTRERLLGLLGAVLPQDSKVQINKS